MSKQRTRVEKRKLLLGLPLLLLPFLALGFYALGGGNGAAVEKDPLAKGINLELLPLGGDRFEKIDLNLFKHEKSI